MGDEQSKCLMIYRDALIAMCAQRGGEMFIPSEHFPEGAATLLHCVEDGGIRFLVEIDKTDL